MNFTTPEYPVRLLLALQEGYCNLKCPMCYVHSPTSTQKVVKGIMPIDKMIQILDEFPDPKPTIGPITWAEPLMVKDFDKYLIAMKERGFPVTINTNGLLLTPEMARLMVEIEVDSVFISVDACTVETLKKVRGTSKLKEIHDAVHMLLSARGKEKFPRIGVSFASQRDNEHEAEAFLEYWLKYVDVVRIGERFDMNCLERGVVLPERVACGSLYDTLVINHLGVAAICCLDAASDVVVGNVFEEGCHAVWHGNEMTRLRKLHEAGKYKAIPLCADCEVWSGYVVEESNDGEVLVRKSPTIAHYNRLDRMGTWQREAYDKRYDK